MEKTCLGRSSERQRSAGGGRARRKRGRRSSRGADLNGDSCRFRARADSRNRSCLFRRGSRCSLRHALLAGSFPPRREIRLTSRHRPMLPAVPASPGQGRTDPLRPRRNPPAGLKQIFRRENNPFAFLREGKTRRVLPVLLPTFSSEFPSSARR